MARDGTGAGPGARQRACRRSPHCRGGPPVPVPVPVTVPRPGLRGRLITSTEARRRWIGGPEPTSESGFRRATQVASARDSAIMIKTRPPEHHDGEQSEKKKNKSPCSSRCGLAALQRGHRHRVHRRYCCLFFGRSGLYPGGRALGCGPGGTLLPSGHARRY